MSSGHKKHRSKNEKKSFLGEKIFRGHLCSFSQKEEKVGRWCFLPSDPFAGQICFFPLFLLLPTKEERIKWRNSFICTHQTGYEVVVVGSHHAHLNLNSIKNCAFVTFFAGNPFIPAGPAWAPTGPCPWSSPRRRGSPRTFWHPSAEACAAERKRKSIYFHFPYVVKRLFGSFFFSLKRLGNLCQKTAKGEENDGSLEKRGKGGLTLLPFHPFTLTSNERGEARKKMPKTLSL